MGSLWLGLLLAGIIVACLLLALYISRLPESAKFCFIKPKLIEGIYEPLVMLENMGQDCLRQIGNKSVELIFDIDKNLPAKLYGDEKRLRQVMMSLLKNGIQYAETGYVRLLLKVYPVTENDMMEMHVSVKDTGKGIGQQEIERLFSFRRAHRPGEGQESAGNSLYVSQRLIRRMGGEIRVKSEEGRGSEFWFAVQQRIEDPVPAAVIKLPENGRSPKVSAKFSNPYREEALMTLLNMYKISFIPYDILQDVGMMADYLFTDYGVFCEAEQEMLELVRRRENICVLENPQREHKKIEGVTIVYHPFFSWNFCRFINKEG